MLLSCCEDYIDGDTNLWEKIDVRPTCGNSLYAVVLSCESKPPAPNFFTLLSIPGAIAGFLEQKRRQKPLQ